LELAVAEIDYVEPQVVDLEVVDAQVAGPHGSLCAACGSPFDEQDRFCPACGSAVAGAAPAAPTSAPAEEMLQRHFRCENCGSEVAMDPDQRSYVCAFCDSTYVVEFSPQATGRQPPEFVIGFAVTPHEAQEKFHRWIAEKTWFRPGDLRTGAVAEKQRGVYLPFWAFTMLAQSHWSASIGEYWYRTETYTTTDSKGKTVTRTRQVRETEWWPLAGRHHRYYAGFLVSGSRGLPQSEAERIKPFQLPALKRYEPFYLAGWLCEEYSIERDEALQVCQAEFYRQEQANVARFLPGDTHRSLDVSTNFSEINSDLCLLPVYILSYRYREKLYRFLVNGQTGKVAGDKPLSWKRIGVLIGAIAAVVILLILILLLIGGLMSS
jgi:hypothetical protein